MVERGVHHQPLVFFGGAGDGPVIIDVALSHKALPRRFRLYVWEVLVTAHNSVMPNVLSYILHRDKRVVTVGCRTWLYRLRERMISGNVPRYCLILSGAGGSNQ